jgi:hypothetical protein
MLSAENQMMIDAHVNPTGEEISEYRFLTTLQRIPDDVVRSISSHTFKFESCDFCICGWSIREVVARRDGVNIENVSTISEGVSSLMPFTMSRFFGGSEQEWRSIYIGVVHEPYAKFVRSAWNRRISDAILNAISCAVNDGALRPGELAVLATV